MVVWSNCSVGDGQPDEQVGFGCRLDGIGLEMYYLVNIKLSTLRFSPIVEILAPIYPGDIP